jgi:hypothetical protein
MVDLWWDQEFLGLNYDLKNVVKKGSFILPFQVLSNLVQVGFIGPYSLAYTLENPINLATLTDIWSDLLVKHKESPLLVRLPPETYYRDLYSANFEVLSRLGARVLYKDVNFHLDLSGDFRDSINRNRSRELRRGIERNYIFKTVSLIEAYKCILANRIGKGLNPSLSEREIIQLNERCPGALRFHGVELGGQLFSSSISLIINPLHAYVFMWGHDPSKPDAGDSISTLCEGLFNAFKSEGLRIMCLGTASNHGVVDEGLSRYKSSLGAIASSRITMEIIQGVPTA